MNIPPDMIAIYKDAKSSYDRAQADIAKNGEVVLHPRTAEPIPNPFLRVRDAAAKQMLAFKKQFRTFDGL